MSIAIPPPLPVTTSAQVAVVVPPGPVTVVLSNTGSTNVVYIGTSNTVTATNGFPLPVNQTVTFSGKTGSTGTTLYAIAAGTGNNLGSIVSTAQ